MLAEQWRQCENALSDMLHLQTTSLAHAQHTFAHLPSARREPRAKLLWAGALGSSTPEMSVLVCSAPQAPERHVSAHQDMASFRPRTLTTRMASSRGCDSAGALTWLKPATTTRVLGMPAAASASMSASRYLPARRTAGRAPASCCAPCLTPGGTRLHGPPCSTESTAPVQLQRIRSWGSHAADRNYDVLQ